MIGAEYEIDSLNLVSPIRYKIQRSMISKASKIHEYRIELMLN
jgi:hypothetical protein